MSTIDPAADFANIADGLEPVSLVLRTGESVAIAEALRRAANVSEHEAADGHALQRDVDWHLPAALLDTPPELGATIVDSAGDAWTILEATLATLGTRWRCRTRNLAIAGGPLHPFSERIAIEVCSFSKGAHGAAAVAWSTWRANVPARIQPVTLAPEVRDEARVATATHVIYLAETLSLDARHRVRDADGTLYHVERADRAERIGELPRLWVRRG